VEENSKENAPEESIVYVEDACAACVSAREHFNPIEENGRIYNEFYPVYRSLYRSLKKDFDSITKTVQVSSQS
jgi:sugar (pentulose or hexulose) kinase